MFNFRKICHFILGNKHQIEIKWKSRIEKKKKHREKTETDKEGKKMMERGFKNPQATKIQARLLPAPRGQSKAVLGNGDIAFIWKCLFVGPLCSFIRNINS